MTKLLVIGASKGIGLEVVKTALAAGHLVRAMARNAEAIEILDPKLELFPGNALDPERIDDALTDVDAVVQALGVKLTPRTVFSPVSLFSRSTEILVRAMKSAGTRRLISVTGFGAGESRSKISVVEKLPFLLALGRAYEDKGRQENLIKASGLDWTIVRPGVLRRGSRTGRYRVLVEPASWRNGLVSRADVADFVVRQIGADDMIGEAPVIVY